MSGFAGEKLRRESISYTSKLAESQLFVVIDLPAPERITAGEMAKCLFMVSQLSIDRAQSKVKRHPVRDGHHLVLF